MEAFSLFSALLFLMSIILLLKVLFKPTTVKPRLPPGPTKLPIIGNLHQLAAKTDTLPHNRLLELARVHGPIMHLRLGEVPTVVISSANIAKEVYTTHETNFVNRPKLLFPTILSYDCPGISFAPYGEYWREVRKIAALELLSKKRVVSFRSIREEEVTNLINSIASEAALGSVVNFSSKVFGLAFDITTRVVFNRKGKDEAAFKALTTKMTEALAGFEIGDLYPSMKWLPSITGTTTKYQKIVQESNKILDPIIEDRKFTNKQGNKENCLLDVLLKFHEEEDPNNTDFSLTTKNIKGIILEIYVAGSDTSLGVIEWVMSELLKNPKIMEKAQAEVRQAYGENGTIDETRLEELKFLKLIIKETLRLHPPAPLLAPRESIERCEVYGYDILPKTRVLVNAWAIGRDPNYWLEPNVFNPERFEGSSIDYKGKNFDLIPFGSGRRICPGMTLAIANVELPLAMLLYHFDWKLPNEIKPEDLNMDGLFGITVKRKNELYVVPSLYSASSPSK